MSSIVKKAYSQLFGKECSYKTSLKYSGKFKGYNANIYYDEKELEVRMRKK